MGQGKEKGGAEGAHQKVVPSVAAVPWPTAESLVVAKLGAVGTRGSMAAAAGARPGSSELLRYTSTAASGAAAGQGATAEAVVPAHASGQELASASKSGGSDLFDALLMAATGGAITACSCHVFPDSLDVTLASVH